MKRIRERNKKYPNCWLENGTFYCRYKHPTTGKDTTAKIGRKTHALTWAKVSKRRLMLMDGDVISAQEKRAEKRKAASKTIEKLAEKYFSHFDKEQGCTNRDKQIHVTDAGTLRKHLIPFFGDKDISTITKKDIENFKDYIDGKVLPNGRQYSQQSRKHFIGFLQRLLNYNDILFSTVFWKSVTPKVTKRRPKKGYLTDEEMANLRGVLNTYPHNPEIIRMMRLLMTYGCRCSELTRLKWKNVNFKDRTVRLVDRKNGAPDLLLGMDDEVCETLRTQRGRTIPHPEKLVFPAQDGGVRHTNAVSRACRRILDKAGIDKAFKPTHGFRDNTAFYLNGKAGLTTASKYLGHTSERTTQGYVETIEDGHVQAVSIMSAVKEG